MFNWFLKKANKKGLKIKKKDFLNSFMMHLVLYIDLRPGRAVKIGNAPV